MDVLIDGQYNLNATILCIYDILVHILLEKLSLHMQPSFDTMIMFLGSTANVISLPQCVGMCFSNGSHLSNI